MSLSPFSLRTLPDHALLEGLRALAARDSCLEADLLVHLGEVDASKLHVAQGFSSLFAYCMDVLHFSESVAFQRIGAARAARASADSGAGAQRGAAAFGPARLRGACSARRRVRPRRA